MGRNATYIPRLNWPWLRSLPARFCALPVLSGLENPETRVPGIPGQIYINLTNNKMFLKRSGVYKVGWEEIGMASGYVSGGNAGTMQVYYGLADNPNGVIIASRPALYYSSSGKVWAKTNADNDAQGWEQLIS